MIKAAQLIGVMWAVFLISTVLPITEIFGLAPRSFGGLIGIFAMPFLHSSTNHLISNSFPLFIFVSILYTEYPQKQMDSAIWGMIIFSGLLLWIFGRSSIGSTPAVHIGASGLVYSVITYSLVSGLKFKRVFLFLVTVIFMLINLNIIGDLFPSKANVSWEGHLFGAITGIMFGLFELEPESLKSKPDY